VIVDPSIAVEKVAVTGSAVETAVAPLSGEVLVTVGTPVPGVPEGEGPLLLVVKLQVSGVSAVPFASVIVPASEAVYVVPPASTVGVSVAVFVSAS
jgi:hypothetical protein